MFVLEIFQLFMTAFISMPKPSLKIQRVGKNLIERMVLMMGKGHYQGEQDTGFKYPGCGGRVLLKAMDMRFSYAWPDKVLFDEAGTRIRQ